MRMKSRMPHSLDEIPSFSSDTRGRSRSPSFVPKSMSVTATPTATIGGKFQAFKQTILPSRRDSSNATSLRSSFRKTIRNKLRVSRSPSDFDMSMSGGNIRRATSQPLSRTSTIRRSTSQRSSTITSVNGNSMITSNAKKRSKEPDSGRDSQGSQISRPTKAGQPISTDRTGAVVPSSTPVNIRPKLDPLTHCKTPSGMITTGSSPGISSSSRTRHGDLDNFGTPTRAKSVDSLLASVAPRQQVASLLMPHESPLMSRRHSLSATELHHDLPSSRPPLLSASKRISDGDARKTPTVAGEGVKSSRKAYVSNSRASPPPSHAHSQVRPRAGDPTSRLRTGNGTAARTTPRKTATPTGSPKTTLSPKPSSTGKPTRVSVSRRHSLSTTELRHDLPSSRPPLLSVRKKISDGDARKAPAVAGGGVRSSRKAYVSNSRASPPPSHAHSQVRPPASDSTSRLQTSGGGTAHTTPRKTATSTGTPKTTLSPKPSSTGKPTRVSTTSALATSSQKTVTGHQALATRSSSGSSKASNSSGRPSKSLSKTNSSSPSTPVSARKKMPEKPTHSPLFQAESPRSPMPLRLPASSRSFSNLKKVSAAPPKTGTLHSSTRQITSPDPKSAPSKRSMSVSVAPVVRSGSRCATRTMHAVASARRVTLQNKVKTVESQFSSNSVRRSSIADPCSTLASDRGKSLLETESHPAVDIHKKPSAVDSNLPEVCDARAKLPARGAESLVVSSTAKKSSVLDSKSIEASISKKSSAISLTTSSQCRSSAAPDVDHLQTSSLRSSATSDWIPTNSCPVSTSDNERIPNGHPLSSAHVDTSSRPFSTCPVSPNSHRSSLVTDKVESLGRKVTEVAEELYPVSPNSQRSSPVTDKVKSLERRITEVAEELYPVSPNSHRSSLVTDGVESLERRVTEAAEELCPVSPNSHRSSLVADGVESLERRITEVAEELYPVSPNPQGSSPVTDKVESLERRVTEAAEELCPVSPNSHRSSLVTDKVESLERRVTEVAEELSSSTLLWTEKVKHVERN